MKLKVSDDVGRSADAAFTVITDYTPIENQLHDAGYKLARVGAWEVASLGAAWSGTGEIRGQRQDIEAEITGWEQGRAVTILVKIGGLRVSHTTRIIPLGEAAAQIEITAELKPRTLSARVFVQGLKLARGRILSAMERRLSSEIARIQAWVDAKA